MNQQIKEMADKRLTLLVGEGDFSFASSYLQNFEVSSSEYIFATCLSSGTFNSNQEANITFIESNGIVCVNESCIMDLLLAEAYFTSSSFSAATTCSRVGSCFLNAEKVLKVNGRIHVTLCQGQGGTDAEAITREWGNSWQIVSLAMNAGLVLCDIHPFNANNFERYECTGYRGLSKSFHMEAAVTHIFCRGEAAVYECQKPENLLSDNIVESFIKDCRNQYRLLSQNPDSPHSRMIYILDSAAKSAFLEVDTIFEPNLFFCQNNSFSKTCSTNFSEDMPQCEKYSYCDKCLHNLLSLFLNNNKSSGTTVTSVICCMCCSFYFDVCRAPFFHVLSYFTSDEASLIKGLNCLFNLLREPHLPVVTPSLSWCDIRSNLKTNTSVVDQPLCIPAYEGVDVKELTPIYAFCSVKKSNCCVFYTNLDIAISDEKELIRDNGKKYFEIGLIVKFSYNLKSYIATVLNLDLISALKYHVMDYRVLLLKEAYFTTKMCQGQPMTVFRSQGLFPPSYIHDVSFWVDKDFEEQPFLMLVRETVGYLIKSVRLIDLYFDEATKRESRCYRFIYQSCDKVLSKETVSNIHSKNIRKTIMNSLNVHLR